MDFRADIGQVVDSLRNAKPFGRACSLLIGAGCSVTAGIPTAGAFVHLIEERFNSACKRAKERSYPHYMGVLSQDERRDLIAEYVDKAKINWGHMAIAQLMRHGYVDRVLTTNFDPLVMRACAMIGEFPAVYDLAASQLFRPHQIPDKAVLHLHGQRTGFVLLNTRQECEEHSKRLGPVFEHAGSGRVWIVVGYSGENDPVFKHLAKVACFTSNLYWVGYNDEEPAPHVREGLLTAGKDARYVSGFDADGFFVTLAQELKCFPPDLIGRPFSHLGSLLEVLTPFSDPSRPSGQGGEINPVVTTRKWIDECVRRYELQEGGAGQQGEGSPAAGESLAAYRDLMAGKPDKVIAAQRRETTDLQPEMREPVAWAHVTQANKTADEAKSKQGQEADRLFEMAYADYAAALKIKPDMHEALNNWGTTIAWQANTRTGAEADRLFERAGAKYEAALKIKPDKHGALSNWGNALASQAKTKTGAEADRLFEQAGAKYEAALKIKPDYHEPLNNWGVALADQAETKTGPEADRLFQQAGGKFEAALKIKPDYHGGLSNWGNALADQAKTKTGSEADRLFKQACGKFEEAVQIKPDCHEALNNWGAALAGQAKTKTGPEADRLFELAAGKYEAALKINPDLHQALYNWGAALAGQAKTKTGPEADRLFELAAGKYEAALKIKPDYHEALNSWGAALANQALNGEDPLKLLSKAEGLLLRAGAIQAGSEAYNLACIWGRRGHDAKCKEYLEKSHQAGELPTRQDMLIDPDLASMRDKPWFTEFLKQLG